jgi:hypothetical protein
MQLRHQPQAAVADGAKRLLDGNARLSPRARQARSERGFQRLLLRANDSATAQASDETEASACRVISRCRAKDDEVAKRKKPAPFMVSRRRLKLPQAIFRIFDELAIDQALCGICIIRLASLNGDLSLFIPEYRTSSQLSGFGFASISNVRYFNLSLNLDLPGGRG